MVVLRQSIKLREHFKNPGISFLVKFIFFFLFLYVGTQFIIGLCAEGGWYSPFIAKHLNYIAWLRKSILHGGRIAASIIGLKTIVRPPFLLQLINGPAVKMVYSCIGVGIMSFWAAFVLANAAGFLKKLLWTVAGLTLIWFINCWRIAILLYTLAKNGNINKFAEHHNLFNAICYLVVFIMMYFFTRKPTTKRTLSPNSKGTVDTSKPSIEKM